MNREVLGLIIIVLLIVVNALNGIFLYYKVSKTNEELSLKLAEISKQLLIQSGYLKDNKNG